MNLYFLDCDGSVIRQPFAAERMARGAATVIDARELGPSLRIVAGRAALARLRDKLGAVPHIDKEVFFTGSGDFHHLTVPLLERLNDEITVVHFDNHPDWTRFPATLNCGSWVCRALALPQVRRIITIGPAGDDLHRPEFKWADLAAIRTGRLEVHPWRAKPTRLFGRAVNGPGVATCNRQLHWRNLETENWSDFIAELCGRLEGKNLWITFDKDVLRPEEAVTNWDHGGLDLSAVMDAIAALNDHCRIYGLDICGDYSPPVFHDLFRRFLSWTDRAATSPAPADVLRINDATNRAVLARLETLPGWAAPPNTGHAVRTPPIITGAQR